MSRWLDDMIDWENGKLDESQTITLFQNLLDSGLVWNLQGAYQRQLHYLLKNGLVTKKG